jgi:conjugative transfer signal peptidase TraF
MDPRRLAAPATILAVTTLAVIALHQHPNFFRWNSSQSEPPGLYVRAAHEAVTRGTLAAFPAPATAYPYADQRLSFLRHIPIIKAVAAASGDLVCTRGGVLTINGERRSEVLTKDAQGATLPQWNGCRTLRAGEFFAFSNRVRNSFDSRYFGPVAVSSAVVYRPLFTFRRAGE